MARRRSPGAGPVVTTTSRVLAGLGLLVLVGALPWLAGRDAAYTVLRARYAEREASAEALAAVRAELGLDAGWWAGTVGWFGGVLRGDLGTSWTTRQPVGPGMIEALGVSLVLMTWALLVALVVAVVLVLPALRGGLRGRSRFGSGVGALTLTALPEFLLAVGLLLVVAVWLGSLPPYGWRSTEHVVLPALALGLPAGGLVGRLVATAVVGACSERWVATWRLADAGTPALALAVLRRAVPAVAGQVGLVVVGLTGGAVAVEEVFAVPGIGRALLGAASAQDVPALQAGLLLLLGLALLVGLVVGLLRRLLLGRAAGLGALPVPEPVVHPRRRDALVPGVAGALLLLVVATGLLRDPYAPVADRLAPPSPALPLGADAVGRDVLARVAHGALLTVGTSVLVLVACVLLGVLVGSLPRAATGPAEVANALPPVVAGLVVAALVGPSLLGAAVAVATVGWAPFAAHTAALVTEARQQPHVAVLPVLGVGRLRRWAHHVLPAVVPPVARHAALRLPGTALAVAGLGFLGLGAAPPAPEWGALLAEGTPYVERAPWLVLGPAVALVTVAVLASALTNAWGVRRVAAPTCSPSGRGRRSWRVRWRPG